MGRYWNRGQQDLRFAAIADEQDLFAVKGYADCLFKNPS
jgi:hypothetical protein